MEVTDSLVPRSQFFGIRFGRRQPQAEAADKQERRSPSAELLVERYRDAVFAYAMHRVHTQSDAEDITAEVFVAAFQAIARCPAPPAGNADPSETDPARAWLLGVARRKVADSYRRRTRRRETSLDASAPHDMVPANDASPDAQVLQDEASRAIRQTMDKLKSEHRDVLLLKYVEEYSTAEIALLLGRSEAAVNSLLQRARASALQQGRDYFLADRNE